MSKSRCGVAGLSDQGSQSDFKVLAGLCYHSELGIFAKLTGCWQNSFPGGCITEVQVFLLAVGYGLLSA